MPIKNVKVDQAGLSGVIPKFIYLETDDTKGTVRSSGYLNGLLEQNIPFSTTDVALVSTRENAGAARDVSFLKVSKNGASYSLVDFDAPAPDGIVYVYTLGDLPPAESGVRQLESKRYIFLNDIEDANQWALPNNGRILIEGGVPAIRLTYTGSSSFIFTKPGEKVENFLASNLYVVGPGPETSGSKLFEITGVGGSGFPPLTPFTILGFDRVTFWTCETFLDATDCGVEILYGNALNAVKHITVNNGFLEITQSFFGNDPSDTFPDADLISVTEGPFIGLSITISQGSFLARANDNVFNIPSNYTGQMVATAPINIAPGSGNTFKSGGLTQKSDRIRLSGGNGFPISLDLADAVLSVTRLVTINSIGVFEAVGGTNWVQGQNTERFTVGTDGLITFTSATSATFLISGNATVEKAGGGADLMQVCLLLNGSPLTDGCGETQSSDPESLAFFGSVSLSQNDTLQLAVANNTTTTDINVLRANVIVTAVTG